MAKPRISDLDKVDRASVDEALDFTGGVRSGDYTANDGVPVPKMEQIETPELSAQWAEMELLKATPRAVQEVIFQLKRGTMKERAFAALQVLDRAGVQARQAPQATAPIIVLTKEATLNIPWVKQAKELGQIVDWQFVEGTLTKVLKEGK